MLITLQNIEVGISDIWARVITITTLAEQAQGGFDRVSEGNKPRKISKGSANKKHKTRATGIEAELRGDTAVVPAYALEVEEQGGKRLVVEELEAAMSQALSQRMLVVIKLDQT